MPKTRRTREPSVSADDILEHELSVKAQKLCEMYVEACGFTSTALFGISQMLEDSGDEVGAKMLDEFMRRFADHEAKTR